MKGSLQADNKHAMMKTYGTLALKGRGEILQRENILRSKSDSRESTSSKFEHLFGLVRLDRCQILDQNKQPPGLFFHT